MQSRFPFRPARTRHLWADMSARKPLYVLNGPNLNLLGVREPEVYGRATLDDARRLAEERAATFGFAVEFRQTNGEGQLVDWIQEARESASGLILNAGAYTHTSIAIHDALKALSIPVCEVHVSNPAAREAFRHHSHVGAAATGAVTGFGVMGYALAVEAVARKASGDAP
jgi:3-dehydroquinate dehydratase II